MCILKKHGYELCDDYSEAEAIIINTCGFINSAKEESINTILEMANYKEDKCQVLIVMGCMVQKYPEELAEGLPEVDVFLGTGSYLDIADILDNYTKEQGQMVEIAAMRRSHASLLHRNLTLICVFPRAATITVLTA